MVYRSKKAKKKLLEKKIKKFFFKIFIPICLFFIGTIFFFNMDFFRLENIKVSGLSPFENLEIKQNILDKNKEKYWGIYKKDNFIFYPESDIKKEIYKNEKVKSVDISYFKNLKNIEVNIEKKKTEHIYCIKDEKCFFMESDGVVFTEFNQEETSVEKKDFLVFFEDVTEKREFFLEKEMFYKIKKLKDDFFKKKLEVLKIEKRDFGEMIFYLRGGTKIIFLKDQDFSKILKSLEKILAKKTFRINKTLKSFPENILYINFSYGETILYCLKEEGCENNF